MDNLEPNFPSFIKYLCTKIRISITRFVLLFTDGDSDGITEFGGMFRNSFQRSQLFKNIFIVSHSHSLLRFHFIVVLVS